MIPIIIPLHHIQPVLSDGISDVQAAGWSCIIVTLWASGLALTTGLVHKLICFVGFDEYALTPMLIAILGYFLLTGCLLVYLGGVK